MSSILPATDSLRTDLAASAKSLDAMLNYMRTVQRVTEDLATLTQYFGADTMIGRRMRDLLQEMVDDTDCISDTANKAAQS